MFKDFTKYEVYEDGKIWSYKTKRFLKPTTEKNGYQKVCLVDNEGKKKSYLLHRVVWESVTGAKIPEGYEINHRNEIKTDNRFFENLELVSHKENINYGTGNLRSAKSQSKRVGAFKDGELIFTFQSTQEAEMNGFSHSAVSMCCRGVKKYKTHKGYTWKYL